MSFTFQLKTKKMPYFLFSNKTLNKKEHKKNLIFFTLYEEDHFH